MADQPQNPPAETMSEPEDMKKMIARLKHEFNIKMDKIKEAYSSLHTFVSNKERTKKIRKLCTKLVVINRDKKLKKYLDELQDQIDKCSKYYHELSDLVNGAEWQKAMKHCEEMKNQKCISKWVGCGGLIIAVGAAILFWPFGLISGTVATIGVVGGAVTSGVSAGFYYSSTCNSKILEECEKAFQECQTIQVHLEEIQDKLRRFRNINDKEERKHMLKDITKTITECMAKITEKNPPEENLIADLCKTVKHGVKTVERINDLWPRMST